MPSFLGPLAGGPRPTAAWLATGCALALAAGAFVQHGLGHPPCSLCVLQRLGFVAVLLFALPIAARPLGRTSLRVFVALTLVAFLAGLGVAAYQVWLGFFPAGLARCGRGPSGDFEETPLAPLANLVLDAAGDCGNPVTFFGLVTMPQLGLAAYLLLAAFVARLQASAWSRAWKRERV